MNDTIEVRLELTQKEADVVAFALRKCSNERNQYKSEKALLDRVARKFQYATRDAECREAAEAHVNWLNKQIRR